MYKLFISNIPLYISKPNNSEIDVNKMRLWLRQCDNEIKEIATEFIFITKYISYNTFLTELFKSVDEMLERYKISNINVLQFYLSNNDNENYIYKSGFWVFNHIKAYIQLYINPYIKNKFKIINENDINKFNLNIPVIIADDASYSGSQISIYIEDFTNKTCNIFILIPFISKKAIKMINIAFKENKINGGIYFNEISNFIMMPIHELMEEEKIIKLFKYYSINGTNINQYPIYFDHKVADSYSSFPLIYSYGIIPNKKNQNIIISCKTKNIPLKTKFNELDKIVFLKNCSNIINTPFDINKPLYPQQPYKPNFIFDYYS